MLRFYEPTHTYETEEGIYTSVTTLLKKFEVEKDWDTIANNYVKKGRKETLKKLAKKYNKTPEYFDEYFKGIEITGDVIRKFWFERGAVSAERGTLTHNFFESLDIKEGQDIHTHRLDGGYKYAFNIANLAPGVYPEMIVYDEESKIAGQIDRLIIEKDGGFYIEDYKTDLTIDFEAAPFWNSKRRVLEKSFYKKPISHLEECKWNKYQLQLSFYAYMLEKQGLYLKNMMINHIITERDEDGYIKVQDNKPVVEDVLFYEVNYLKPEIKSILKTI